MNVSIENNPIADVELTTSITLRCSYLLPETDLSNGAIRKSKIINRIAYNVLVESNDDALALKSLSFTEATIATF